MRRKSTCFPGRIAFRCQIYSAVLLSAAASFITHLDAVVTPLPDGLFQYTYSLSNAPQSDLPAVALSISVSPDANLTSLIGPTGWDVLYTLGATSISWESPASQYDITSGTTGAFSFTAPLPPASADFTIIGFDDSTLRFDINQGPVAGPASVSTVPEPSNLVLLVTSGLVLLGYRWRCRSWPVDDK